MFAIVGTDGTRDVVWGIGHTVDEAREDAHEWLYGCGGEWEDDSFDTEEITAEQAEVVEGGDVSWPIVVPRLGFAGAID